MKQLLTPPFQVLSIHEIERIVAELQTCLDSKVQNIFFSKKGLGIELFRAHKTSYLWFDMDPTNPLILLVGKLPTSIKLLKSVPLLLFLKAHLLGKRISEITHIKEFGRVIEFQFGYENPLKLELRLFPHGVNAIAHFEKKRVAFDRIKEIKTSDAKEAPDRESVRSLIEISQNWLDLKSNKSKNIQTSLESAENLKFKEIKKKENALDKTLKHLEELKNDKWSKLGEWLKSNQTLKVPKEFSDYIDPKKSFSQNIQISFAKAKKNHEKISGTQDRIDILKDEIKKLKETDPNNFLKSNEPPLKSKKSDNWSGYRFILNPKVEVFVGKSAQENLTILRYAQSWDYWMHIKDYPGAHGIIRRPRNFEITDEEFQKVGQFIAAKSKKSAHFLGQGESFEVLIVECRYVKTLKSDKLGRVSYSNERVLHCRMPTK
jgi:predicted ribosome quality control (RQC) complex YloA/Tae2 family protein